MPTKYPIRKNTPRRKTVTRRPTRRNPVTSAADMYRAFTGIESEHVVDVVEKVHVHTNLAAIAELNAFKLVGVTGPIKFAQGVLLGLNETGTQLFIRGGDQSLDLREFNRRAKVQVDPTKETVILGHIDKIWYTAAKPFLGKQHAKRGPFVHQFGKSRLGIQRKKTLPYLVYDTRSHLMSIAGGMYYIKPTDYDGRHSRGIID